MKLLRLITTISLALGASSAWGHGFELTLNFDGSGNPVSISSFSQQSILDADGTPPSNPTMIENLFKDSFYAPVTDGTGTFQPTPEGGPSMDPSQPFGQTWQSVSPLPTITFNVVSPLYYSDGTNGGVVVPASAGTHIYFSDAADAHPNTSGLHATLTGSSATPVAGWQLLSPYDATPYGDFGHEIYKQLYIDPSSTQTDGEYGFAFTITAHFAGGLTVTSGPLVDIYALDPSVDTGGFLESDGLQDAATIAIYNAATAQQAVPEPSAGVMALLGMGIAGATWRWKRRRAAGV